MKFLSLAGMTLALAACSSGRPYEQGMETSSLPPRPQTGMVREPARPYGDGYSLGRGQEQPRQIGAEQPGSYRWNGNSSRVQEGAPPPTTQPPARLATTSGGQRTIVVRPGDTLYSLARHHGITVAELAERNGLTSPSIKAGQQLVLPPNSR